MKAIGLIGGMSWRSSAAYYRFVNEEAARLLGGFHSAVSVMYSVDSQGVAELQHEDRWDEAAALLARAARARGGGSRAVVDLLEHHARGRRRRGRFRRHPVAPQRRGAEAVVLGCTEMPLLIAPSDVSVPLFDTAELHARAAVAGALRPASVPG